jgi:hypothetical protein
VPPDVRDEVVDFVRGFTRRTQQPQWWVLLKLGIHPQQFERWGARYGALNLHNGKIPRDHWTEDWEKAAIFAFHEQHPLEGYRRLAFMMLDADVVAVSPATVYRVLKQAGRSTASRGTIEERHGLRPAAPCARALAYRCHAHQHRRDLLLLSCLSSSCES